ncbi:MAG: 5'/3'-nucleotidase SurE [Chitinophagales bacterium]
MRFLLTNDDGWHSKGIQVLAAALKEIADISIVAPDRERSATGHSITVFKPLMVAKIDRPDLAPEVYTVSGTPVDCVKMAVSTLLKEKPDMVISGINNGPNLGTDVLYSGTVSAAVEGVIMGVPSLAVSLASYKPDEDYEFSARFTRAICRQLINDGIQKDILLNVNIPAIAREQIKALRITRLGKRNYENTFEERKDPRGRHYFWLGGDVVQEDQEPDSDVTAVAEGYISVTPIHFDLTDYRIINEFRNRYHDFINHVPNTDI